MKKTRQCYYCSVKRQPSAMLMFNINGKIEYVCKDCASKKEKPGK